MSQQAINTYHTSEPCDVGGLHSPTGLLATLTIDAEGLYAVYIAPIDLDSTLPDYVTLRGAFAIETMQTGLKQSYEHALAYFPDILPNQYRD